MQKIVKKQDYRYDILIHVHVHGYARDFGWIYAKFREIRVFYFRASLRLANAKNAEEKSQVRIVFERSAGRERRGEKRFGSSGEFLRSPYTTLGSTGSDKAVSSACNDIGPSEISAIFPSLKFPGEAQR